MGQQGLLHLPRADVEPAPDDDVLDPPGDPQVSVLVEPADITSAPPAFIVGGLRGEIRPAPVLEQSPRTAVPDLAVHTDRSRPSVLTDDADLDAGNRPAVGAGHPLHRILRPADGGHHDLAGAVGADHAAAAEPVRGLVNQGSRDGSAGGEPEAQSRDVVRHGVVRVEQHPDERSGTRRTGALVLSDALQGGHGVEHVQHVHRGTGQRRGHDPQGQTQGMGDRRGHEHHVRSVHLQCADRVPGQERAGVPRVQAAFRPGLGARGVKNQVRIVGRGQAGQNARIAIGGEKLRER